jgi:hypothetical protein
MEKPLSGGGVVRAVIAPDVIVRVAEHIADNARYII